MPSEGTQQVNFRTGELAEALEARADGALSPAMVAKRDLARYYALLARSLPRFTLAEASLLVGTLNGLVTEPHTAHLLWANVDDAIRMDRADQKWAVDGPALVARLRDLSPCAALAVADACERWWNGPDREEDRAASLRRVGLVR